MQQGPAVFITKYHTVNSFHFKWHHWIM